MREKNVNCPCTHVGCPGHGDCAACEKIMVLGKPIVKSRNPKYKKV